MGTLPVQCSRCGYTGPAPSPVGGVGVLDVSNLGIRCPRCRGIAKVVDGLYSLQGDVIALLSTPGATLEALRDAAVLAHELKTGGATDHETAQKLAKEMPWLAGIREHPKKVAAAAAIFVLQWWGGKILDAVKDAILPAEHSQEVHEVVKSAVETAFAARDLAARSANVIEPPRTFQAEPNLARPPTRFAESMKKLERYRAEQKKSQRVGLNAAAKPQTQSKQDP